ncbi:DUF2171 domain-containing protein [Methylocella sp.]|uniref:DUF2171 domain-containing protein n=1 Tax=Methylocella sp. TaxID=1978226 RepID=UPI0035B20700
MVDYESGRSSAVAAFFDTHAAADAATADLVAAGVAPSRITVKGGDDPADPEPEKSLWESLKHLFMPEEERRAGEEAERRHGYVVMVKPFEHEFDSVRDILARAGATGFGERAAEWRRATWTGAAAVAGAASMNPIAASSTAAASAGAPAPQMSPTAAAAAARSSAPPVGVGDASIRLPDETAGAVRPARAPSRGIAAHMEVLGADGIKIGEVDHLEGERMIQLTREASPDDRHHFVPMAWVDHVDSRVHLNRSSFDARLGW